MTSEQSPLDAEAVPVPLDTEENTAVGKHAKPRFVIRLAPDMRVNLIDEYEGGVLLRFDLSDNFAYSSAMSVLHLLTEYERRIAMIEQLLQVRQ